jgi:CDP-glucose 4,6-dehydratase
VEDLVSGELAGFYAGKTVLVTGHTGFKGSWLTAWLARLGARVVGMALPPEGSPNLFDLAGIADKMVAHVTGDVRDLDVVRKVSAAHRPDVVFHLAAQALVRRSYRSPVETLAANVLGTAHVLEACRELPELAAVVIVTSDKCYENREQIWGYREPDAMGGADPYSASKGCAELVTAAYRRSFFAARPIVASARAGNVIGGGDFAEDRLVPDIMRGIAAGQPVAIRNPRATRPWQHVLDPLSGYLLLAKRLAEAPLEHGDGWNFGPRDEEAVPVGELAQRLVDRLGRGSLVITPDASAPHEAHDLRLDCSKAARLLRWIPRFTLRGAVDRTAEWYAGWLDDPRRAADLVDRQIIDYMASPAS